VNNDPSELLGYKNFYFKVQITEATALPNNLNKKAFVTYQFKFEKGTIHSTMEVDTTATASGSKPIWNYEKIHCIEEITPQIVRELKAGSISFQIYAYPPSSIDIPKFDAVGYSKRLRKRRNKLAASAASPAEEARILGLDDHKPAQGEQPQEGGGDGVFGRRRTSERNTLRK